MASTIKIDTVTTPDGTGNITFSRPIVGDGSGLTNVLPPSGLVSGSAQIESDISGSFIGGFNDFSGNIRAAAGVWSAGGAMIIGKRN